jgi:hypothetical protein
MIVVGLLLTGDAYAQVEIDSTTPRIAVNQEAKDVQTKLELPPGRDISWRYRSSLAKKHNQAPIPCRSETANGESACDLRTGAAD